MAKRNVLTYGHDLWWRTFNEVAREYPDVKTDYNHVDACCMWMVKNPEFYDVIVTTNMFGDIITDLAAVLQGGLGVAAGGNINPDPGGLSMYEPMGGKRFLKYTGKNIINPIAAIAAAGMMLQQCGHPKAGDRVMKAVEIVTGTKMQSQAAGKMGYGTREIGDLVCEAAAQVPIHLELGPVSKFNSTSGVVCGGTGTFAVSWPVRRLPPRSFSLASL